MLVLIYLISVVLSGIFILLAKNEMANKSFIVQIWIQLTPLIPIYNTLMVLFVLTGVIFYKRR